MLSKPCLLSVIFSLSLRAQDAKPANDSQMLSEILGRLQALEEQNRALTSEVHDLRQELRSARAGTVEKLEDKSQLEERVAVAENRIAEQAQTKVETSAKFPITLTGEVLFNAFSNTGYTSALPSTNYSSLLTGESSSGATLRQSIVGLRFHGPSLPGGGRVSGEVMLDFYSGSRSEQLSWLRLRVARIDLDWKHRSVMVGQDKPLISPHQPNSLAEVFIPPLADSGNLWLWLPQARYEERIDLGHSARLSLQAGILQTDENYSLVGSQLASVKHEPARPAAEGRVAFKQESGDRRLELGAGFHHSTSHILGQSPAASVVSVDWLYAPWRKVEFSGTFFHGQNFATLGALAPGISVLPGGLVQPVRSRSVWGQISLPVTSRLTFNLFAGVQDNVGNTVLAGSVKQNLTYAGNLFYRLTPNVLTGIEALQQRSQLALGDTNLHNRYDLALAYLF